MQVTRTVEHEKESLRITLVLMDTMLEIRLEKNVHPWTSTNPGKIYTFNELEHCPWRPTNRYNVDCVPHAGL